MLGQKIAKNNEMFVLKKRIVQRCCTCAVDSCLTSDCSIKYDDLEHWRNIFYKYLDQVFGENKQVLFPSGLNFLGEKLN